MREKMIVYMTMKISDITRSSSALGRLLKKIE